MCVRTKKGCYVRDDRWVIKTQVPHFYSNQLVTCKRDSRKIERMFNSIGIAFGSSVDSCFANFHIGCGILRRRTIKIHDNLITEIHPVYFKS